MHERGAQVPIPVDLVCAKQFSTDAEAEVKSAHEVADDDLILDIGPQTAQQLAGLLKNAGTIVWYGTVGVIEVHAFDIGTRSIAIAIAYSDGFSIVVGEVLLLYISLICIWINIWM